MKISTKGRYALRLMLDLAEHKNDGFLALHDIADRQNISKKYLEQIVPVLNKADLLHANRGFQGGYKLSRDPSEYTVGEILRATEGGLAPVACLDRGVVDCDRADSCVSLPFWKGLYNVINNYVDSVSLQDLIDQKNAISGNDYVI